MDTGLVLRAQRGDERAFESLVYAAAERLHAVAYRILRDGGLAEDAMQQALLAMWRRLPTLRDPDRFEAWAYRILVRVCYEEARQARARRSRLVPWPEHEPCGPDALGGVEDRERFERVFARLSLEHRTVIVLHHYLDMTHDEIAEVLGISQGTVKSRLSRALTQMRRSLGSEEWPSSHHDEEFVQ